MPYRAGAIEPKAVMAWLRGRIFRGVLLRGATVRGAICRGAIASVPDLGTRPRSEAPGTVVRTKHSRRRKHPGGFAETTP